MKTRSYLLVAGIAAWLLSACGGKTQPAGGDADSVSADNVVPTEQNDTTPPPMFLLGRSGGYAEMCYWAQLEQPWKTKDNADYYDAWALQDRFCRNARQYVNLLVGGKVVGVKFVDEVLKDPDGNLPSIGELHGRAEIPALGARFIVADAKERKALGQGSVVVTDAYLKTRKLLPVKWKEGTAPRLPADIVAQLETRYGMKAQHSEWCSTIGDRYKQGIVQFAGAYKAAPKTSDGTARCLALEVIADGDKVYAHEALGYYADGECTWNVDDGGEYIPCTIEAAFEGPRGLELCYTHPAPESCAFGMFYLRDGKYEQLEYSIYHSMIDEEIPVWKKDIAEMQKLYVAADPHDREGVKFTKWAHTFVDYTNEWIWLRDKDDTHGAIFLRKDGKFRLVATETAKLRFSRGEKGGHQLPQPLGAGRRPVLLHGNLCVPRWQAGGALHGPRRVWRNRRLHAQRAGDGQGRGPSLPRRAARGEGAGSLVERRGELNI